MSNIPKSWDIYQPLDFPWGFSIHPPVGSPGYSASDPFQPRHGGVSGRRLGCELEHGPAGNSGLMGFNGVKWDINGV